MGRTAVKEGSPAPLLFAGLFLALSLSLSSPALAASSVSAASSAAAQSAGDELPSAAVLARPGSLPTDNANGALLSAQETPASGITRDATAENAVAAAGTVAVLPGGDAAAGVAMIRGA